MRYFSQLARETTARVLPSRRPTWLQPIPAAAGETVAEWPAPPTIAPSSPISQTVQAPGGDVRTARRPGNVEEPSRAEVAAYAPRFSAPTPLVEGLRDRAHPQPDPPHAIERGRGTGNPAPPSRVWPIPTSLERREPHPPRGADLPQQQMDANAPAGRETMPTTLQGIISELARRQQELERRYQADQIASRNAPARAEMGRVEAQTVQEIDGVLLNIGSIVVQVEPEHVASRAPSKPSPRENRNDWKRSFLDR